MSKLIRNKIPEIAAAEGRVLKVRKMEASEAEGFYKAKIMEEAMEVAQAKTKQELIEELADLSEILDTVIVELGLTKEVIDAKYKKFRERGGFHGGIILE